MTLPPRAIVPHGPTNLAAALEEIARASKGQVIPTQLVMVTDGQTQINEPARLATALRESRIRVSLLAIGDEEPNNVLRQVVRGTQGALITPVNPGQWSGALQRLVRSAAAPPLMADAISATFTGALTGLEPLTVSHWNRTWLKSRATSLATAPYGGAQIPLIATWNVGAGKCVAAAYQPHANTVAALVKIAAMPPRDPRFTISWTVTAQIRVVIHARQNGSFMNGLMLRLIANADPASTKEIPQTGPGEYALTIDRPRGSHLFTISENGRILDRRAIAGIYPPEFDKIGIDRTKLAELARRTGGRVIEPDDTRAIALPRITSPISLTAPLAILGGAMLAIGLVVARRG